jgi:hypothetical protein
MRAKHRGRSSGESFGGVPLVEVKRGRLGRETDTSTWLLSIVGIGCMDGVLVQHRERQAQSWNGPCRDVPKCLTDRCSADWRRITGPHRFRHPQESTSLTLPRRHPWRTIGLRLHESLTDRPGRSGLRMIRQFDKTRRRRGVGVDVFRSSSKSDCYRGSSRPVSRDDTFRKRRCELPLLLSRSCYWTSCNRGMHERPMKIKVVRRVGEGFRSRPNQSSGVRVPNPSASPYEGVGRTRP